LAALAIKKGELEKEDLNTFIQQKGMPGFVPTQGHIPSGIPFISFARKRMLEGAMNSSLIIGKGSLFLGRMTNLFDGVSLLFEKNTNYRQKEDILKETKNKPIIEKISKKIKIAVSTLGYEHDIEEIINACTEVMNHNTNIEPIIIGKENSYGKVQSIKILKEAEINSTLNELIDNNTVDGALAMHYPFAIGIASVSKLNSHISGKNYFLATTTGNSSSKRVEALIKNTIAGISVAKADGLFNPKIGLLNLEGASMAKRALDELASNGYPINWVASQRKEKDILLRGNDLLSGEADVIVVDSLTGNILVKVMCSYMNGGKKEIFGYGYGPGIGEGAKRIVNIISRASGSPVIANAIRFVATMVENSLIQVYKNEIEKAYKCGLSQIINKYSSTCVIEEADIKEKSFKTSLQKTILDNEISGIDILEIEKAVNLLLYNNIYATAGMGCTGPVVMINKKNREKALEILKNKGAL